MAPDPMTSRERLNCLQMFLQSAELRLIGCEARPEMELNCELSNVARGNCLIRFLPVDIVRNENIGHIEIPAHRPIMRCEIAVTRSNFDIIVANLRYEIARPIALVIALQSEIETSCHGDFLLTRPLRVGVRDLSWVFPLK